MTAEIKNIMVVIQQVGMDFIKMKKDWNEYEDEDEEDDEEWNLRNSR